MEQFRPRLSRIEIEFFLEVLASNKAEVEKKLKRLKELKGEIYRLRKLLEVDPYGAIKQGFRQKKEELKKLESESLNLRHYVTIYEGLCSRFQNLLDGKQEGRLKAKSQLAQTFLRIEKRR